MQTGGMSSGMGAESRRVGVNIGGLWGYDSQGRGFEDGLCGVPGDGHVVELRNAGDLEGLQVTVRLPRNHPTISVRVE